jgi:hypothetical protein
VLTRLCLNIQASASIMMITSLSIRTFCVFLGIDHYIPFGFIFAFPSVVQILSIILPFTDTSNPLLIVRIAETLMGRICPSKLTVVIPAHFLGCIVGTVCFRTVLPFVPLAVVQPVVSSANLSPLFTGVKEVVPVCLYVCCYLTVPDVLEVNKLSRFLVVALMMPLLFVGHGNSPV